MLAGQRPGTEVSQQEPDKENVGGSESPVQKDFRGNECLAPYYYDEKTGQEGRTPSDVLLHSVSSDARTDRRRLLFDDSELDEQSFRLWIMATELAI